MALSSVVAALGRPSPYSPGWTSSGSPWSVSWCWCSWSPPATIGRGTPGQFPGPCPLANPEHRRASCPRKKSWGESRGERPRTLIVPETLASLISTRENHSAFSSSTRENPLAPPQPSTKIMALSSVVAALGRPVVHKYHHQANWELGSTAKM